MTDLWTCSTCGERYPVPSMARDCAATHRDDEADDSPFYTDEDLED